MALFPPHIYPGPESPPSPLSHRRQRKGRGQGGAGLPLGTAVAQSISPKPRNFLLPKRKKKKKKIPAATFPPCPIGTDETGSVGFPGRVAQGWNTLRQEWWSSLAGPPPGPLWASPLSSPFSPPSKPPEVAFPCPQVPGLWAWGQGPGGCAMQPWGGWGCGEGPGLPHTVSLPSLPQSWAFPSTSCCGDVYSPPQKSVPSSGPPARRTDQALGLGGCRAHGLLSLRGTGTAVTNRDAGPLRSIPGKPLNAQSPCRPFSPPLPLRWH